MFAAQLGFEPRYADPESAVLPLDDRAINLYFIKLINITETNN